MGNKVDVRQRGDGPTEADEEDFMREYQFSDSETMLRKSFRCSCKTSEGVHEMFDDVAKILAATSTRADEPPSIERIRLQSERAAAAVSTPRRRCCR